MGLHQSVGDQLQTQIGVGRVSRFVGEVGDDGADRDHLDATVGIRSGERGELRGRVVGGDPGGAGRAVGAQFRFGKPGVEHGAVGGDGGKS